MAHVLTKPFSLLAEPLERTLFTGRLSLNLDDVIETKSDEKNFGKREGICIYGDVQILELFEQVCCLVSSYIFIHVVCHEFLLSIHGIPQILSVHLTC